MDYASILKAVLSFPLPSASLVIFVFFLSSDPHPFPVILYKPRDIEPLFLSDKKIVSEGLR